MRTHARTTLTVRVRAAARAQHAHTHDVREHAQAYANVPKRVRIPMRACTRTGRRTNAHTEVRTHTCTHGSVHAHMCAVGCCYGVAQGRHHRPEAQVRVLRFYTLDCAATALCYCRIMTVLRPLHLRITMP